MIWIFLIIIIVSFLYIKSVLTKKDAYEPSSECFDVEHPIDTLKKNAIEIALPERKGDAPIYLSACYSPKETNNYKAYFKNGVLSNVKPRDITKSLYDDRQKVYDARYIISDGVEYDLESVDSINSMVIPRFGGQNGSFPNVTSDLSYIMKMKANAETRPELAVALTYKAANLMLRSPISHQKKDYYQIIKNLWSIGEIYYADYLLEQLNKQLPFMADDQSLSRDIFDREVLYAQNELKTDLLFISYSAATCEDCAKYQNRIYSLTGKDKRFPILPEFIKENKGTHCSHTFSAVLGYDGETLTKYSYDEKGNCVTTEVDAVKYSNRPFVDDRTPFEKRNYEECKLKREQRSEAEERYYSKAHWVDIYKQHLEYQQIVELLKENAPKSYSGYARMKSQNTKNYQKIVELAIANNIKIN